MRKIGLWLLVTMVCACAAPTSEPVEEKTGEAEQALTPSFVSNEVFDFGYGGSADSQRGADPFVRVAPDGEVYVASTSIPLGQLISDGGALWRSSDDGSTWDFLGTAGLPIPLGLEPAMDIDAYGRLWMAEFFIGGPNPIFRYDSPDTITNRATDYSAVSYGDPPGERPWVSSYGDRIHVQYGIGLGVPGVRISTNGSANPPVFTPSIPIAQSPAILAELAGGTNTSTTIAAMTQGPLAVNKNNGKMCAPILVVNGSLTAGYLPAQSLWTACSFDGGMTWTNTLVYKNPDPAVSLMSFWPDSAVDSDGNLYFVVSANMDKDGDLSAGPNIFLFSSKNNGNTWSAPKKVNGGEGTNIFPKMVAGCEGGVDVVWYKSNTTGQPDTLTGSAEWRVRMAQTMNATAAHPSWDRTNVAGRIVHYGPVNHRGTFNTGVDYRIFTMPSVTLDDDGMAHVVWADTSTPWVYNPNVNPLAAYMGDPPFGRLFHSRQTSGQSLACCD